MNKIFFLVWSVLLFSSCADVYRLDGDWDDIIQLSTRSVELYSGEDSVIITTVGDWWWINDISFEDSIYYYNGVEDVDVTSDYYSIKEECFTVERRDKNTLFVKINENKQGHIRELNIYMEAGDYFDAVRIYQASD